MGERQREKRREEKKRRKMEGRWRRRRRTKGRWRRMKTEEEEKGKDVRGDTERRGENKGFQYWYNNQKYVSPCEITSHVHVGRLTFSPLSKISCHTMYCLPSEATSSSRLRRGEITMYFIEILMLRVITHFLHVVEYWPTILIAVFYVITA